MGIVVWQQRRGGAALTAAAAAPPPLTTASAAVLDHAAWEALERQVSTCTACELHRGRSRTVFGTGDRGAELLVIGEAPGAEEDRRGEPFVGRAGQLLNAMLAAIGLPRETVYIANIVKCRPPRNRDPEAAEVAACSGFLAQQIALLQPRAILAVGRIAAQNLLGADTPIGRLRGRVHSHAATSLPIVVTYHPAYLLRSPEEKRKVWTDLLMARELLEAEAGA
ncbi:MAG: uracil-DNA glycosylase [Gammaproteobacteria bacterium]